MKQREGVSVIMRHCRWVETTDPVERAELFGRLDGIVDAICTIESASSLAEAAIKLRALERRYADQYEGRIPTIPTSVGVSPEEVGKSLADGSYEEGEAFPDCPAWVKADSPCAPWKRFDYENPPPDGIYWVVVNEPEYDVDVDGYGRTIGRPTDETKTEVCMVSVYTDDVGQVVFEPIERYAFGEISDEAWVSHYAEVTPPAPPVLSEK